MTVNILDSEYQIIESNKLEDDELNQSDGYCDFSVKKIVIDTFKQCPGSQEDLDRYKQQVIRHEIVHAFLHESGLDANSWASDEEIVDWIALQFPKMMKAFIQVDAI